MLEPGVLCCSKSLQWGSNLYLLSLLNWLAGSLPLVPPGKLPRARCVCLIKNWVETGKQKKFSIRYRTTEMSVDSFSKYARGPEIHATSCSLQRPWEMRAICQKYKSRNDCGRGAEMNSRILSWLLFVFAEGLTRMLILLKLPKREWTTVYKEIMGYLIKSL